VARLEIAATAYRQAIEEMDAEGAEVARAVALLNLGTVLVRLGERRGDRSRLIEARQAMQEALAAFESCKLADYVAVARRNLESLEWALTAPRTAGSQQA
jgi:hypothetical protein